ncbi:hypothetical protein DFR50_1216 [Roseiarcus fermentans]|uniref:Uncharacterized protein n=1 Tax=Roseiarcus fermentans TaxID=1473586 RepID=A0A366F4T9_9HYPH|nr:hypothetical protein [Roseiarcus fermentans]RBP09662.1 hypothetical protein DFR50_1216 [Roseiarcus fermentans]
MKRVQSGILGAVIAAAIVSALTPAFALGGCGRNFHRNAAGVCVRGGQNEDYCLRTRGHTATRMPDGRMRCL